MKMKKLFAILMSVLMIFCFMPTAAFAAATENCTGTCTHQAAIGTTHYGTLAEAIEAATADAVITLLSDVTVDSTIIVEKNLTIAGGEYTLKVKDDKDVKTVAEVHKGAILTISSGNYTADESHGVIAVGSGNSEGGKLIVNGGTFQNTETCIASFKGGEVVINNGIFTSTDNFQVCTNGTAGLGGNKITINGGTFNGTIKSSGYIACGIYIANDDELVVNGGTFNITNGIGIVARAGRVTVNGGTFNCTGSAKGGVGDKNFVLDAGKDLYFDNSDPAYPGYNSETNFMKVRGGTFTSDPSDYVADSSISEQNNDGKYVVRACTAADDVVAQAGDKYYKTLVGALKDAGEDSTVTLMKNATEETAISIGKAITLDLAGKTLTTKKQTKVGDGGQLTIKDSAADGRINLECNGGGIMVNGGKLILESGTLYQAGGENVFLVGSGEFEMTGGKMLAGNGACIDASYGAGTAKVEISGGLVETKSTSTNAFYIASRFGPGKVEASISGGSILTGKQPAVCVDDTNSKLTITGGTFTGDPSTYVENIGESYIVKRNGSEENYTYTVLSKSNLTSGVYMSDPSGALASRYYVSDSNDGKGPWTVSYAGGGSSSSTTTTTDNVTNKTEDKTGNTTASTTATVKSETKTNTDGTKTTTATVDTTTAAKIVEKAVENKSEEVVVNTTTTTAQAVTETAAGTKTEVALPEQTVKSIANETDAAVTIKSDAAEVKLDKEAVKAVAEQAGDTGTVSLVVETVAQSETKVEVDLKLVTSKGNVTEFKGGSVSVTVKLNAALAAKPVVCVYIDDFGTYHKVKGVKNANGTYTFETGHFSTYAVMAEEDADKVITEQTANVEKLVSDLSLKARSTKTEKGNIKVTLTVNADDVRQIEDLGYTVKYKFYRSTKKAKGYKDTIEGTGKTYTNTAGTKGTRYYYKARVMVYDAQGALVAKTELTQCRYACRTK